MEHKWMLTMLCVCTAGALSAVPGEWKEDLSKLRTPEMHPENWTLNPVRLSKDPDSQKAEATVKKSADGTSCLSLAGGTTTMAHFFQNTMLPVQGGAETFELSFEARGSGGGVSGGCYVFSGKKWLRTIQHSKGGLKNEEWKKYTFSVPIPAEWKGKAITELRPVIICGQKQKVEIKNISWKIIPNVKK